MTDSPCFSCGGIYPDIEGPTHRYMKSTPGCWSVYGEVLAREYSDLGYWDVHRLTVDTYAVQHPGVTDRHSIPSVGLHLVRLCLLLEHGLEEQHANAAMKAAAKRKHTFTWLVPPDSVGTITASDIANAQSVNAHKTIVREWAMNAFQAWSLHHDTIRSWLPYPSLMS